MTKAKLQVLERLFSHEITEKHPLQNFRPSKHWRALIDEGMVQEVEYRIGFVICRGYTLTPLGCMTYCQTCDDEEE